MADYAQGVPIRITDTFRLAGVLTNPTAVVYSIRNPDGTLTTYTWPGAPEISNTGAGVFRLSLAPPADPGQYPYDVDATGAVVASRHGSFNVLPNVSSAAVLDWAVGGPCTPWASSQDVWSCCAQPTVTIDGVVCNVDFSSEAMAASQVLYELSGRRFSGSCSKTVRPCGNIDLCGVQVLSRGHLIGWDGSHWGSAGCGCSPIDRVLLSGYPVRDVTEVKIDGVVVAANTYRLDERRWLTRVRDPADLDTALFWPACQGLDLPDTASGTFSVTYRYGMDPPLVAIHAAAELACQLYKACSNSGDCALPSGTTRVSRQGIVIERLAFSAWGLQAGIWRTGLTRVDTFLNSFSRYAHTRRPMTWSPDGQRFARPVGQ